MYEVEAVADTGQGHFQHTDRQMVDAAVMQDLLNNMDPNSIAKVESGKTRSLCGRNAIKGDAHRFNAYLAIVSIPTIAKNIKCISLGQNNIPDAWVGALLGALGGFARLESLQLQLNNIQDAGAEAIAGAIAVGALGSLIEISLAGNKIGDTGATSLAGGLGKLAKLERLWLSENQIGDAGAVALAQGLRSLVKLRRLHVTANKFGNVGAGALAALRSSSARLHWIELDKKFSGEGKARVIQQLPTQMGESEMAALECGDFAELDLAEVMMGEVEGTKVLIDVLGRPSIAKKLIKINLGNNQIGNHGATALGGVLAGLSSLQTLWLFGNKIGCVGAKALAGASALGALTHLRELSLAWNQLGDDGVGVLAATLGGLTNLDTLLVNWNQIGDAGAIALVDGIRGLPKLQHLHLGYNQITCMGVTSLPSFTQLKSLDLVTNRIGDDGAWMLGDALRGVEDMRRLNLMDNNVSQECRDRLREMNKWFQLSV